MILNRAFGGPELLPFDLRMHRIITYNLPSSEESKAPIRRELERALENAVRLILPQTTKQQATNNITPSNQPRGLPSSLVSEKVVVRSTLSSYDQEESGRGYYSIYGELYNDLDQVIYMPDVEVTFYDAYDNIVPVTIGSGQRFCSSMVLYPKSSTPFHYYVYGPRRDMDTITRYEMKSTYSPRSNGWIEMPFEIQGAGPNYDKIIARNDFNQDIQGARLIMTNYNDHGQVSGTSEEPIGNVIYTGGSWEFTVRVPGTPYDIRVEGRSKNL